jgi:hypothetical protein
MDLLRCDQLVADGLLMIACCGLKNVYNDDMVVIIRPGSILPEAQFVLASYLRGE